MECIVVSHDGTYLASMSQNGKRIKIFSVETKELLKVFRRGFTEKSISQMLFNKENNNLCVITDQTIHVWTLEFLG